MSDAPNWVGQDGKLRCSFCASLHPDAFIAALGNEPHVHHWQKNVYNVCETQIGPFMADHLQDMPCAWLKKHSLLIARTTGTLFYWAGEVFKYKTYPKLKERPLGSPLTAAIMKQVVADHAKFFAHVKDED